MKAVLLLLTVAPGAAVAQFTLGVKAGVPLTDIFETISSPRFGFNSETKRYIIGPTVELRLPAGLSVEFDALYRRFNYDYNTSVLDILTNNRTTGNAWEFPLMLKYRFPGILARPFVAAGANFDTFSGLRQTVVNTVTGRETTSSNPTDYRDKINKGVVVGAGVDVRAVFIHISPEIRYTRWGSEPFRDLAGTFRSSRNQAEFLVGFTF